MVTTLQLTQLEAILADQESDMQSIQLARDYFAGKQIVNLTNGAQDFLGLHDKNTFRLNICRTIVTSLAAELNLLGFDTSEPREGETKRPVAEWLAELYRKNKLDSLQDGIHEDAIADRETFVLVEFDPVEKRSRLIHHKRFVSTDAGGDGDGIYMLYENDDPNQRPRAAVKQWIETNVSETGIAESRQRRTVYYPDRIDRFVDNGGGWVPFEDEQGSNIPWTRNSEPIGIPVFHFKNKGLRSEHWDAIPMQDAINKEFVDALAAGDLTAFQSYFGFGFYPTVDGKAPLDDGSNLMKMGPAQFNGTNKPSSDAALQIITGADITPFFNALTSTILLAAQITETPASKFVVTGQIAAADTIKEQNSQLKKKAGDRRGLFSDPWVGAASMARTLENIFGGAGLPEEVAILPVWEKSESIDDLERKKTALEIPIEQVWREAGYTDEQVDKMRKDPSYRLKYEAALWEGAQSASLQGVPLEVYLKRVGLPEAEIKEIVDATTNQEAIPSTNL